jgi:endonuclease III
VAAPIAIVLRKLSGRYPLTMLGSWNAKKVSAFRTLIGTILSARSRDEMTDVITQRLFERFPTPKALATADRRAVEKILQPIGFYRTKASYVMETARLVKLVPKRLWPVINEALVAHGKAVCKPIGPTCDLCSISAHCRRVGVGKRKS